MFRSREELHFEVRGNIIIILAKSKQYLYEVFAVTSFLMHFSNMEKPFNIVNNASYMYNIIYTLVYYQYMY